eukprot:5589631-Prymnesium_polylepis.2
MGLKSQSPHSLPTPDTGSSRQSHRPATMPTSCRTGLSPSPTPPVLSDGAWDNMQESYGEDSVCTNHKDRADTPSQESSCPLLIGASEALQRPLARLKLHHSRFNPWRTVPPRVRVLTGPAACRKM